jgi:FkbH-like protein
MPTFPELKRKLKNDLAGLEPVRIALLGDTTTPFLAQALRGTGFDRGFDLQLWEADFNQIERQVFDRESELYTLDPQVIILFHSSHKLLLHYNKQKPEDYAALADNRLELIGRLCARIEGGLRSKIIYYNYTEINDAVFGNYANKTETSFLFQLRKLNYGLMQYAASHPNFYCCDLSVIQNQVGKLNLFHPSIYVNSDMVLSIDALPAVAATTMDLIGAFFGRIRKCLILDVDNTIWGGVIGDDGMENIQLGALGIGKAFTELQYWVKKLKYRGVILAVASKNTESVVIDAFDRHPDMVLTKEDIAIFKVNWENKVDNIRQIQAALNIGFDSMVFLDDNPFERNMVRAAIPAITVPELPEDPADYLEYLYTLNLFETISLSDEDRERTKLYQTQAQRESDMQQYNNEDDFLAGLNMRSAVDPFNSFNTPRVAQLSQRSNQFNLRTVRYTEAEIGNLATSPDIFTFSFTLEDKYGDNGTICVVILKKETDEVLFIDTWLMSCRVLKRGMENFTLNTIVGFSREKGFRFLKGEWVSTAKNEMVKAHYPRLGFQASRDYWLLDLRTYENRKTHVHLK